MHSTEGFNSFPEGYEIGQTKYIIINGSVLSGVGKGVITASLSRLLEDAGKRVLPFKFDGYLNRNAGTLNPYRHGEVFVLDDGKEGDMDLGTYERFLNTNLTSASYMTGGELMWHVLKKESLGGYLGKDVQYFPHVVGEMRYTIRERAMGREPSLGQFDEQGKPIIDNKKTKPYDVMLIEVGGTVGDFESNHFHGAMRWLIYEEGVENAILINIPYIVEPESLQEQKSKPAQTGLEKLMSFGLTPNMIIARSKNPITNEIKDKIGRLINLKRERIYNSPNVKTIYEIPLILKDQGIMKHLPVTNGGLESKILRGWPEFVERVLQPAGEVNVMIAGKYTKVKDAYASIEHALVHAGAANDVRVNHHFVETTNLSYDQVLDEMINYDGLIVPGGFGTRGIEGKLNAIRVARETKKPFLGLCYGMQLAVIEYARNVCGLKTAHTTEINPQTKDPVVFMLPEQIGLKEMSGTMRLGSHKTILVEGSKAAKLYGQLEIKERFRHRYEVNPEYVNLLETNGLIFSGESESGLVKQVIELIDHPFFMASQFHPELTSKPLKPSPLFKGFIQSCK